MRLYNLTPKDTKGAFYYRKDWCTKGSVIHQIKDGKWINYYYTNLSNLSGSYYMTNFNDYEQCDSRGGPLITEYVEFNEPKKIANGWFISSKYDASVYLKRDGTVSKFYDKIDELGTFFETEKEARCVLIKYRLEHKLTAPNILSYNDDDTGKIFAKVAWRTSNDAEKASTKFSWDPESRYYAYCDIKYGQIVFKKPHHQDNIDRGHKSSKVGDAVLSSELKQLNFTPRVLTGEPTKLNDAMDPLTYLGLNANTISTGTINTGEVKAQVFSAASNCETSLSAENMATSYSQKMDEIKNEILSSIMENEMLSSILEIKKGAGNTVKEESYKQKASIYDEYIQQINKTKNKEKNMPEITVKNELKETLRELLCEVTEPETPKTPFEKRKKYSVEVYGLKGELLVVNHYDRKKDAKRYLQDPANIGRTIVLKEEVAVYTTDVPVVEVK